MLPRVKSHHFRRGTHFAAREVHCYSRSGRPNSEGAMSTAWKQGKSTILPNAVARSSTTPLHRQNLSLQMLLQPQYAIHMFPSLSLIGSLRLKKLLFVQAVFSAYSFIAQSSSFGATCSDHKNRRNPTSGGLVCLAVKYDRTACCRGCSFCFVVKADIKGDGVHDRIETACALISLNGEGALHTH